MDQKSLILGWMIGRQIAGQRKPLKAEILDINTLQARVFSTTATVYMYDSHTRADTDHVIPEREIGILDQKMGSEILSAMISGGHLIIEAKLDGTATTAQTEEETQ